MGLILSVRPIVGDGDLASVAILAIGKLRQRSEHTVRRPIRQIVLQRDFLADRRPGSVIAPLHKPQILAANKIKWQKPHCSICKSLEKRLRPATLHMPAANRGIYFDLTLRLALAFDGTNAS